MDCPSCKAPGTIVKDSRESRGAGVRRRRKCVKCNFRFTTYEHPTSDVDGITLMKIRRVLEAMVQSHEGVLATAKPLLATVKAMQQGNPDFGVDDGN